MKLYFIILILLISFIQVGAQNYVLDAGNDKILNCFDEITLDAKIITWTANHKIDVGLKSIFFVNDTIGYAAGGAWNKGKILKTINGGESWFELEYSATCFLEDVYFLNKDTGFVTGGGYANGVILKTTDGGITWAPKDNTYNAKVKAIYFVNDTIGFVVGESVKISKTIDGGETWIDQIVDGHFNDILFINETFGYVVGDKGAIMKTNNGGNSWEVVEIDNIVIGLHSIDVHENDIIISGEEGLILFSNNFFESFTIKKTNVLSALYDVNIINTDTMVAVGRNNCILRTEDRGKTWSKEYSEYEGDIYCFASTNKNKQFIAGGAPTNLSNGAINKYSKLSDNIQVSWKPTHFLSDPNILNPILSPSFSEQYILEVTDSESIYLTDTINVSVYTPGIYSGEDMTIVKNDTIQLHGIHEIGRWELIQQDSRAWFNKVEFLNKDTGFIVAGQRIGAIIKTTDGGMSWQHKLLDREYGLFDISFANDSIGFAVGTHGSIYKTSDFGENWFLQVSNTSEHLRSVYFVNENLGFATGDNNVILRTENGGETWQVTTISYARDIDRVYFINETTGFIVENASWECSYFKTVDSGKSWNKVIIKDVYPNPVDFFFLNENDGYMLGRAGATIYIFRTNNGGETWDYNSFPRNDLAYIKYTSFFFTNELTGYITSGTGEIFKTTDGGKSLYLWDKIESGLNDISFMDENNGFAVGDAGVIARYHAKANIEYNWTPYFSILNENTLNPHVFPKESTNYYFSATDGKGCTVQDDVHIAVGQNISSIKSLEYNSNKFDVYPNPSKEKIFINCDETIQKIILCDMNGHILVEKTHFPENNSIDISQFKPGTYILHLTTNKNIGTIKIIKE